MTTASRQRNTRKTAVRWGIVAVTVAALAGIFVAIIALQPKPTSGNMSASGAYAIGDPGPGANAPAFTLPSTAGGTVSLEDYRGKTVLLYFHEGLGCQPCWDQIRDLDAAKDELSAAGVDQLLTITSGPVDLIAQKMSDDGLAAVALADTDLDASRSYNANQYGMMGDSRDGHSFILIEPDGRITWRADYGGSPNYTMYVPVDQILADMAAGQAAQ